MKIKSNKINHRFLFWAGIIFVGIAAGMTIRYSRAWVEPPSSATPPGGDIAAPINTGATTQTKRGGDICVDTNGDNVNEACLSTGSGGVPQGTIAMWSGSLASLPSGWALCNGNFGTPDLKDRFVLGVSGGQNPGATGSMVVGCDWGPTSTGWCGNPGISPGSYYKLAFIMKMGDNFASTILAGSNHTESECTSAGGEVVFDGASKFCRFNDDSCPSGWTNYNNWSETQQKTCNGTNQSSCTRATNCTTGSHGWSNTAREDCAYDNDYYYSGTYWVPQTAIYNCTGDFSTWNYVCDDWTVYGYYCQSASDPSNYFGCGYYQSYSYCAVSPATCWSDIEKIGCF